MIKVTSIINRFDMNSQEFEKSEIENLQEITIGDNSDIITYFSPMITMMISMLTDKSASK
jgi:hypothetical protein